MTQLIRRDLSSAFKLLRDRSSTRQSGYYNIDEDESAQLVSGDGETDVVHFERNKFLIQEFKVGWKMPFDTSPKLKDPIFRLCF
jgi:hypothetical protein